jgi:hypothetical protein
MTKEQAIEKIKWSIHISELTKNINGSNASINVEVLKTVLSMLEEKDKQIDLMTETINNHDIDEDICKQMGQKEDCNEFEDKEKCKDCIKQYFENKAKEVDV